MDLEVKGYIRPKKAIQVGPKVKKYK